MAGLKNSQHLKLSLKEIELAIGENKTIIGKGGYGEVYKGELSVNGEPTTVAIKRLNEKFGQGLKEFLTEIELLSGQKHPNLIYLIGFCNEGGDKSIVYEYAERGSLDQYLKSSNTTYTLSWQERLRICLDAASGLDHLHNHVGEHQTIIHRDIKSSNILIDQNWVAKISDLGLSRLTFSGLNRSAVISHICGTRGYYEPEYHATGIVTKESDVYSLGMVLFEVLCGRLCLVKGDDGLMLTSHLVKSYYKNNTLHEIVDPSLKEEMNSESMNIFSAIAFRCLDEERGQRPSIDVVVKKLEESLEIHLSSKNNDGKKCELNDDGNKGELISANEYLEPRSKPYNAESASKLSPSIEEFGYLKISLKAILWATNNFGENNRIGEGRYGKVYKGELLHFEGRDMVAIKRLDRAQGPGLVTFLKEIMMISRYRHENVVSLLGFCHEDGECILVHEYLPNKSLDLYLSSTSLSWRQRLQVCIGAAHGLEYLHNPGKIGHRMLHRDITSSNILLDKNWNAKISDFGLYKIGPNNQLYTAQVANAIGTLGYVDPSYMRTGILTNKSDIYSFGVVLYEVLCGRVCVENYNDSRRFLPILARKLYTQKKLDTIIHDGLRNQISPHCLDKFSTIAYRCLLENRKERPSAVEMVEELEAALKCQMEYENKNEITSHMKSVSILDEEVDREKKVPKHYP